MFAGSWLAYPQFRMLAAAPVDGEDEFTRARIVVGDDVGNEVRTNCCRDRMVTPERSMRPQGPLQAQ